MNSIYNQNFIDTHIHLWDLNKNSYDWINKSSVKKLQNNYLINDYFKDTDFLNINKAVHIQAEINKDQSLLETKWLQSIADNNKLGIPNAIIGFVDLQEIDFQKKLEQHMQYANFRGIRQILKYDRKDLNKELYLLNNIDYNNNLKILGNKNLNFDLLINYYQYKNVVKILMKNKNVQFIINHCLWPIDISNENFQIWKNAIKLLSKFENVCIKISGFGELHGLSKSIGIKKKLWSIDSLRPFIEYCIDSFGIRRCMFGTNFPVDKAFAANKYIDYWYAYHTILENFNLEEKNFLFTKNAEHYYKI